MAMSRLLVHPHQRATNCPLAHLPSGRRLCNRDMARTRTKAGPNRRDWILHPTDADHSHGVNTLGRSAVGIRERRHCPNGCLSCTAHEKARERDLLGAAFCGSSRSQERACRADVSACDPRILHRETHRGHALHRIAPSRTHALSRRPCSRFQPVCRAVTAASNQRAER